VLGEVGLHQCVQQRVVLRLQRPLLGEDVAERPGLVQHPGVHGGDQGVLADEVHLQGQDAEQQVPVRGRGGHGDGPRAVDSGGGPDCAP
jgi:hypothetical protein